MGDRLTEHLHRRQFLSGLVATAVAVGVAGKMGISPPGSNPWADIPGEPLEVLRFVKRYSAILEQQSDGKWRCVRFEPVEAA